MTTDRSITTTKRRARRPGSGPRSTSKGRLSRTPHGGPTARSAAASRAWGAREHLPALKKLHAFCRNAADALGVPCRVGYHAKPSLEPLHVHVVSVDLDSEFLKNKRHFASFATDRFVDASRVERALAAGTPAAGALVACSVPRIVCSGCVTGSAMSSSSSRFVWRPAGAFTGRRSRRSSPVEPESAPKFDATVAKLSSTSALAALAACGSAAELGFGLGASADTTPGSMLNCRGLGLSPPVLALAAIIST